MHFLLFQVQVHIILFIFSFNYLWGLLHSGVTRGGADPTGERALNSFYFSRAKGSGVPARVGVSTPLAPHILT